MKQVSFNARNALIRAELTGYCKSVTAVIDKQTHNDVMDIINALPSSNDNDVIVWYDNGCNDYDMAVKLVTKNNMWEFDGLYDSHGRDVSGIVTDPRHWWNR